MIPNKTKASEYRVRTLDRNDLNEKGTIYIGQGGTSTIDKVENISNVVAKNIIDAINENATNKNITANSLTATSNAEVGEFICTQLQNKDKRTIIQSNGAVNTPTLTVTENTGKTVTIYGSNGNIQSDGTIEAQSFNAKSDKRLKENIVEYSPNKSILDLPIYSYNFISDEKKTKKIGCLAQDLKEICLEIVKEDDKGYLSIEENKIVYLLLDEVKKLKKRVDELEAR